jgi:hypothetical protein
MNGRMRIPVATLAVALSVVVSAQSPSRPPYRVGPSGDRLNEADLAELARVAQELGETRWVVVGRGTPFQKEPEWLVDVYFAPSVRTARVRRGRAMSLKAPLPAWEAFDAPKTWSRVELFDWAQVPIANRPADEVIGNRDLNRPFRIEGTISDATLVSALAAIRHSPLLPPLRDWRPGQPITPLALQVQGAWPIARVRGDDTHLVVWLHTHPGESGRQMIFARPRDGVWAFELGGLLLHEV